MPGRQPIQSLYFIMHALILMAFFLVLLPLGPVCPSAGAAWTAVAVACYLAVAALAAYAANRLGLRALLRGTTRRAHQVFLLLTHTWLLGGLAGLRLLGFGNWKVLASIPLLYEIVALAPFVAALLLVWMLSYGCYSATRQRVADRQAAAGIPVRSGWTFREYIDYNLRHQFLFIAAPVAMILLATDCLRLYMHPILPERSADAVTDGLSLLLAGGVFVISPAIIVRLWKTRRLPAGPLRDRLEAMANQLNLRHREILLWQTGDMIANAAVMGAAGAFRYILLTDALVRRLPDKLVESVFAHEAGHIRSHHIPYMLLFAVSSILACSVVGEAVMSAWPAVPWAGDAIALTLLIAVWATGFGWLSRRFERQSDVTAACLVGPQGRGGDCVSYEGAATFAQALQWVAQLNGTPMRQFNWRHGSILRRVDYILELADGERGRSDIDRAVRRIKTGLWLATILSLAATLLQGYYAF